MNVNFFCQDYLKIDISCTDDTAGLLGELGRFVDLEPSLDPSGVRVVVFSLDSPPDEVSRIREIAARDNGWLSHNIRDQIEILESSDRNSFFCGIRGCACDLSTLQSKPELVVFLVNSVLALLSDRVLLIHGALIVEGGRGHILTGPSGAGKTTAASRIIPPWNAPADDLIAAVKTGSGYVLHALPTWSQLLFGPGSLRRVNVNASYSLEGIHFLDQSEVDQVKAVTQVDATGRLLRASHDVYQTVITGFTDAARLRCKFEMLKHASAITAQAPADLLGISMNGRFWELF